MLPVTTTIIKARKWPLWIVYLLICAPFVVLLFCFDTDERITFYLLFGALIHMLFAILWYAVLKMEIGIYHDALIYKNAIKTKEIAWKEIIESELLLEPNGHGGNARWVFETGTQKLILEPFYFSRTDNKLLAEVLIKKAKQAVISENIVLMAHGRFPWYLF